MIPTMMAGIYKSGSSALPSSFSGLFTTSAATSTITSSTRTYTLGSGNSGDLKFQSVVQGGTTFTYSKNAGAFTAITEGLTINLANGDTLAIRGTGMTPAGVTNSCSLIDVSTANDLEDVALTRT